MASMTGVLFLGGPPLRPARGCEGHRFHVLALRPSYRTAARKIVGYWTVGRWYFSGIVEAFPAAEGPNDFEYLAPLPEPSPASLAAAWPEPAIVLATGDESLHWLLSPRRSGSLLPYGPQPAVQVYGVWSVLGIADRFDAEAMRSMGWNYVCPAKIGKAIIPHAPEKRSAGEHHPFPPGDPATLGVAPSVRLDQA